MASKKKTNKVSYPEKLISPIKSVLKIQLKNLKQRKKEIQESDPFEVPNRINDNASPDADAEEQFGHARTTAMKEQLDRKIIQTRKALARLKIGEYGICENCGNMIDTDRLMIYPEATLCIKCERKSEKS